MLVSGVTLEIVILQAVYDNLTNVWIQNFVEYLKLTQVLDWPKALASFHHLSQECLIQFYPHDLAKFISARLPHARRWVSLSCSGYKNKR